MQHSGNQDLNAERGRVRIDQSCESNERKSCECASMIRSILDRFRRVLLLRRCTTATHSSQWWIVRAGQEGEAITDSQRANRIKSNCSFAKVHSIAQVRQATNRRQHTSTPQPQLLTPNHAHTSLASLSDHCTVASICSASSAQLSSAQVNESSRLGLTNGLRRSNANRRSISPGRC